MADLAWLCFAIAMLLGFGEPHHQGLALRFGLAAGFCMLAAIHQRLPAREPAKQERPRVVVVP